VCVLRVCARADHDLVNSERHPWLGSYKPDLFVILRPYWRTKTRKDDYAYKCGVPFSKRVWNTVRCIIDVKNSISNEDRGQLKDYACAMCASEVTRGVPTHGMLIDRSLSVECYIFNDGEATQCTTGSLLDEGSKEFLSQFLCWGGEQHPQLHSQLKGVIEECNGEDPRLLGIGGSGAVYDTCFGGTHFALKIISKERSLVALKEEIALNQLASEVGATGHVPVVHGRWTREDCVALQLCPVGVANTVIESKQMLVAALTSLRALHRSGWTHGDARWPNFIFCDGKAVLIDFETANKSEEIFLKLQDVYRLIASVCNLAESNNLRKDAVFIVESGMKHQQPLVAAAIREYTNSLTAENPKPFLDAAAASLNRICHEVTSNHE